MSDGLLVDIHKDLTWLYDAPPLLADTTMMANFNPADHRSHNVLSQEWHTYPCAPAYRLGKQFEDVVAALIRNSPSTKLLARNLTILDKKRTLGELDYLIQQAGGQILHLEVAIKFYLHHPQIHGLSSFIGPGGRDRLDIKQHRLQTHQLPLTKKAEVHQALLNLGLPFPTHRAALLTGYLFYPYHTYHTAYWPKITELHSDHYKGWWLRHSEIEQLDTRPGSDTYFVILPRHHWIAGLEHQKNPTPLTATELKIQVTETYSPNMIVEAKEEKGRWQTVSRGIIVKDSWPN